MNAQDPADHIAIVAVATCYATALDTKQWGMLSEVFSPAGIADYGPGYGTTEGAESIAAVCAGALEGLTTQHLLGNHTVVVDGETATHSCYFHAQHVRPGFPGVNFFKMAGTYDDKLVRTEGGWRITYRLLTVVWTEGNPAAHSG